VLDDAGWSQFPLMAKTVATGVKLHEADYFGRSGRWINTGFALALAWLCVTGTMAWWRRKPARSMGVPPPEPARMAVVVARAGPGRIPGIAPARVVRCLPVVAGNRVGTPGADGEAGMKRSAAVPAGGFGVGDGPGACSWVPPGARRAWPTPHPITLLDDGIPSLEPTETDR
jgi:hypothetical protein